mmetsp:Transcript_19230/g.31875  ORF Transcript_19230/g.31875 Transcript_19230/m.31875 type:complete len:88 (-) Transcript_19230:50-313(-)
MHILINNNPHSLFYLTQLFACTSGTLCSASLSARPSSTNAFFLASTKSAACGLLCGLLFSPFIGACRYKEPPNKQRDKLAIPIGAAC